MDLVIACILSNLCLFAVWLALVFGLVHVLAKGGTLSAAQEYETFLCYLLLLPGGVTSIYVFIVNGFYPQIVAEGMRWPVSPFQWEGASAALCFAATCFVSLKADRSFRLATILGFSVYLWTNAWGNMMEVTGYHNFMNTSAGVWVYMALLIPAFLVLFYSAWQRALREEGCHCN